MVHSVWVSDQQACQHIKNPCHFPLFLPPKWTARCIRSCEHSSNEHAVSVQSIVFAQWNHSYMAQCMRSCQRNNQSHVQCQDNVTSELWIQTCLGFNQTELNNALWTQQMLHMLFHCNDVLIAIWQEWISESVSQTCLFFKQSGQNDPL